MMKMEELSLLMVCKSALPVPPARVWYVFRKHENVQVL